MSWLYLLQMLHVCVGVFHSGVQNLSERRGWQHDLASMTEGAYAEIKNPTDGLIFLCLTWVELVHVLAVVVADVACLCRRFPQRCSEFVRKERMTTWLSQHDWGRICWDKKSNRWSDFLVSYLSWACACLGSICCRCCMFVSAFSTAVFRMCQKGEDDNMT